MIDNATPTDVAWIGSAQYLLMTLTSAVAGPLYDHGPLRLLLLVGTLLVGGGLTFPILDPQCIAERSGQSYR